MKKVDELLHKYREVTKVIYRYKEITEGDRPDSEKDGYAIVAKYDILKDLDAEITKLKKVKKELGEGKKLDNQ